MPQQDMDMEVQNTKDTNHDTDGYFQLISTFEINIPDDFVGTSTPHLICEGDLQDNVALNLMSSQDSFDEDSLNDSAELLKSELNKTYTKEDLKDLLECSHVKKYQANLKMLKNTSEIHNLKSNGSPEIRHNEISRDNKKSILLTVSANAKKPNKNIRNTKKIPTSRLNLNNKHKSTLVSHKVNTAVENYEESMKLLLNLNSKDSSNKLEPGKRSNENKTSLKLTVICSTCVNSIHCSDYFGTNFHYCPSWVFLVKELNNYFVYTNYFQTDVIKQFLRQHGTLCANNQLQLTLRSSLSSVNTLVETKKFSVYSKSFEYHMRDFALSDHRDTDAHCTIIKKLPPGNTTVIEENILPTISLPSIDNQSNKFSPLSVAEEQNSWSGNHQTQYYVTKLNISEKNLFSEYKSGLYWDYYGLTQHLKRGLYSEKIPDSNKTKCKNEDAYCYVQTTFLPYESISDYGSSANSSCDDVFENDRFERQSQSSIEGDYDQLSSSFSGSTDSKFSDFDYEGKYTNHHSIDSLNLTKQNGHLQIEFNNNGVNRTSTFSSNSIKMEKQYSSLRTNKCGTNFVYKINKRSKEKHSFLSNHYYLKINKAEKSSIHKCADHNDSEQFSSHQEEQTTSIHLETVKKSLSCSYVPQSTETHFSKLARLNVRPVIAVDKYFQNISKEYRGRVEKTASINLGTVKKCVICSNVPQLVRPSKHNFSKLPGIKLLPDKSNNTGYQDVSMKNHPSKECSKELLNYHSKTNKYSPFNVGKFQPNDSSKLPVLIDKASKIKDTHWTEKFQHFKEKQKRKQDQSLCFSNQVYSDDQTNQKEEMYKSLKVFTIAESCANTDNKRKKLLPIVSKSILVSSSRSSLDFENNYSNFNCSEEWVNKTSSELQFCNLNSAQESADISLKSFSENSILPTQNENNKSSNNITSYQKDPPLKTNPQYESFQPIPLKIVDSHTNYFRTETERMKFPNAVKKVVTNMTKKRLSHVPEPYDPFKSAERQMLELLEPEKELPKLEPTAKFPILVSSPTSAFTKFPSSCNTPEPLFIIEDFNSNFSSRDECKSPLSSETSYSPVTVTPLDNYSSSKDSNRNAINLSTLSLCSTISIESVDSNKNGYRMGLNGSAKVPEKKTPIPLRRTVSALESRKSRDPLKGKLKMEDMLYGGSVIPGERYFGSPIITGQLEKYIDDHRSSGSLNKAVSDTETLNAEQELLKSMSEFEKLLSSSSSSPSPSSPSLKLFPSLVSSYQTEDLDKYHEMDLHPVSHTGAPDSAYSSLNRKSPVGGEQERDFAESPGIAKFCHECGTKYPMLAAKFCCQCGIRRLII